jgi:hypothetical protein
MLFVCPECGDLGCGSITVEMSITQGRIVWCDFAYENNYDPTMTERDWFAAVWPFAFEPDQYAEALWRRSA